MWSYIIGIGAILLIIIIIQAMKASNNSEEIANALNSLKDFERSHTRLGIDLKSAIAVDEKNKQVCFIKQENNTHTNIFKFHDILSSEIIEDGQSITKTSRTSQAGGALIGAIALGPVGALIGGLSGSKIHKETVSKISLAVTVNDLSDPIRTITFLNYPTAVTKDNNIYKDALEEAKKWQAIIANIIRQADNADKEKE